MRWIVLIAWMSGIAAAQSAPFGLNAIVVEHQDAVRDDRDEVRADARRGGSRDRHALVVDGRRQADRGARHFARRADDAGKVVVLDATTGKAAKGCAMIPT
jgi:hypothetical protein